MQRIMIAGTASGSGKTTIVCAVLQALVNRRRKTAAFKCGPDFIDPMFHSKIIGTKSRNLDGYFMDRKTLNALLYKNTRGKDIAVIEGVMGYYDGLGMEDTASSYALARDTETPVVLVVPCKGMGRSVQAVIDGYVNFKEDSHIKGVIFNQLAPSLYPAMKAYSEKNNIRVLGCFPKTKKAEIGSRHLGLITVDEIADLKEKMQILAELAEQYIDLEGILELAQKAKPLNIKENLQIGTQGKKQLRIAVARDKAFCFYYEDNLELLRELGSEIVEFSPIADQQLPKDIDGLILGGGYPELYADVLEKNHAMRQDIKEKIQAGLPTHAECGGFLYLHREITTPNGTTNQMAGVLDGTCIFTEKLQHFGYVELVAFKDNLLCKTGDKIRAHEFHRCVSDLAADTFRTEKGDREWCSFCAADNLLAGFPHIHDYANPQFAINFVEKCADYSVKRSSKLAKNAD